jgi:hypothetical protein
MAKPISFFSGYSQKENRVTNYCLLVLKMVYEENPKYLGEVLAELVGEEVASDVGVVFKQQQPNAKSIPDGLIVQSPLTVFIETKNFDWFSHDQLQNHFETLKMAPGRKVLLALSNFEPHQADKFGPIRELCREYPNNEFIFEAITFEEFVEAVRNLSLSKNLKDVIEEFREFLNESNLLPSWQHWLDVVNCAQLPEDIVEHGVYICPARPGAYSHYRCRFFGLYRNKRVERVAEIEAVVEVDLSSSEAPKILWNNGLVGAGELRGRAVEKLKERQPHLASGGRVFLLGPTYETDFRKDTPGGMMGPKQYFDVSALGQIDAKALAEHLHGKTWTSFKSASA